jgi:hypothetical protein
MINKIARSSPPQVMQVVGPGLAFRDLSKRSANATVRLKAVVLQGSQVPERLCCVV